jgi:hypothetical protein
VAETKGDMQLVLRVEKCQTTSMPYVSLGCEGADCPDLLAPCSQDTDCSGTPLVFFLLSAINHLFKIPVESHIVSID